MRVFCLLFTLLLSSFSFAQDGPVGELSDLEGLGVGALAPLPILLDQNGNDFSLKKALEAGPLIIVFYRGHWCPYCSRHLAELEEIGDSIRELGGQLIAISPEKPEFLQKMQEKSGAQFTFLYDAHYETIMAFDLAFLPSAATRAKYNRVLGAKMSEAHEDDRQILPVPATYLIGENGIILWRHFDPNYKNRSKPSEILDQLRDQ
jgi:peroxiredoxin